MLVMPSLARWWIILISIVSASAISESCHAQIISGVILDYDTKEPVPFASVYFNTSYRGTIANQDGHFELNVTQFSGQEMIVSCLGYKSETVNDYVPGKYHRIYLKRQHILLQEVIVEAHEMSREDMLGSFLKEFLGNTANGKKCIIENQDDLFLTYDKSSRTLTTTSAKPLIIHNKALGFRITYFLEEFRKDDKNVEYYGHSIFEDVSLSANENDQSRITRRRQRAYLGSRMHFFRALWNNSLKAAKFVVDDYKAAIKPDLRHHITNGTDNTKYLNYPNTLFILFRTRNEVSFLSLGEDHQILFNDNGYFEARGNSWLGFMAEQRVGDLLPFEYQPTRKE